MPVADSALIIWSVAALATALVIVRPGRVPEYVWALGAAVLLTTCGLIPWRMALSAVAKGGDVYMFLVGMMVLAELARQEGLFDWLARYAVQHAKGSGQRLFDLVFLVGTLVTVFLSNDATAVVLTPAVYAACKAAKAEPLPYLFICAFIANAASFVLPISNPANLVVFGSQMPPLLEWLRQFSLPSLGAIAMTYLVLRLTQRKRIRQPLAVAIEMRPLSAGARLCALGLMFTGALLLTVSALDVPLGLPTFCAGMATVGLIHLRQRRSPAPLLRHVAWGRAAAGGGPVRAGGGGGPYRRDRTARAYAGGPGATVAGQGELDRGRDRRRGWQPDEQPAHRPDRRLHRPAGRTAPTDHRCLAYRRRSGAEPVDHRFPGHAAVAGGDPPRGRACRRAEFLAPGRAGNAPGTGGGTVAAGGLSPAFRTPPNVAAPPSPPPCRA
ncbi:hypothetical protein OKW51_004750 [Pseudomonas hunanensis]|nr:hypothetical protein [Pseudomonas hunanensis]